MKKWILLLAFASGFAQKSEEEQLKAIYHQALTNSKSYTWLE